MRTTMLMVWCLGLVACGSKTEKANPEPAADAGAVALPGAAGATSGSRLKTRSLSGTDGARAFLGWHDAQLNVDCEFRAAGDGMQRCLPSDAAQGGTYFSDAKCTSALVAAPRGCAVPTLGLVPVDRACGASTNWRVFTVAAPYTSAGLYSLGLAGACASVSPGNVDLYSLAGEVPASYYVAAAVQVE